MQIATFGQRLERAMMDEGYTQASLGRAMGLSRAAINQLIHGSSKGMKPENLITVCRLLRVRPEWLALGEEPRQPILQPNDTAFLQSLHRLPAAQRETVASLVNDLAAKYS